MAQTTTSPEKKLLTDRFLKTLMPAPAGQRRMIWDVVVPGFGVRVSDRADANGKAASISYIAMRRLPGEKHPTRVTIGRYHPDALPLAKAREEARRALGLIAGGTKPAEEKRRRQRQEAERRASTVGALAADYIKAMQRLGRDERPLRNAREFEAIIRREFLGQQYKDGAWNDGRNPIWRNRPLAEITAQDAARLIHDIKTRGDDPEPGHRRRKSGGPWAAHHALAIGKTMFGWAVDQHLYAIDASPFERLKPKRLIGEKRPRQRILDDAELRAVWKAAERVGGPYGDLVRVLMLTGQRLAQTATMQRAEIDLDDKALWVTPAEKMKMDKPHATPLAPAVVGLLRARLEQPTHRNGYVFSTTGGARPISGFSKFKTRLDHLAEEIRREQAGEEAPDPMLRWVLHDIRRTVRTNLPGLDPPVADVVAEAVLAHSRPGIAATYDLHTYLTQKTDALQRWAAQLKAIINPPPPNVVPMRKAGRARA